MQLNEVNSLKNFSFSCIYLWTNVINNKHYVGQAHNFYNRMMQYRHGFYNKYMTKAINKYGVENFDITILEKDVPYDKLDEREQYWLDYYQSYKRDKGYNICQFASTTFGYKHTDEDKKKMSNIRKEKCQDPEYCERWKGERNGMYGKHRSDENQRKMSEYLRNRWANDEEYREFWRNRMSGENNYFFDKHLYGELNGMYGKHHSDETKRKISQSKSGKSNPSAKRRVKCVETDIEYDSMTDAANDIGVKLSTLSTCIIRKLPCKGYHFIKI